MYLTIVDLVVTLYSPVILWLPLVQSDSNRESDMASMDLMINVND
jgi:hypothetical protein